MKVLDYMNAALLLSGSGPQEPKRCYFQVYIVDQCDLPKKYEVNASAGEVKIEEEHEKSLWYSSIYVKGSTVYHRKSSDIQTEVLKIWFLFSSS